MKTSLLCRFTFVSALKNTLLRWLLLWNKILMQNYLIRLIWYVYIFFQYFLHIEIRTILYHHTCPERFVRLYRIEHFRNEIEIALPKQPPALSPFDWFPLVTTSTAVSNISLRPSYKVNDMNRRLNWCLGLVKYNIN